MNWLGYLLAVASGLANPVQSGANAQLNKSLQQPVMAALVVYITGLLGVMVLLPFFGGLQGAWQKTGQVPWWAWAGGLLSILSTMTALVFARKMGAGVFTCLTITSSIVCSVALDHFGLVGFQQHPAGIWRIVGAALMVVGLFLVARS